MLALERSLTQPPKTIKWSDDNWNYLWAQTNYKLSNFSMVILHLDLSCKNMWKYTFLFVRTISTLGTFYILFSVLKSWITYRNDVTMKYVEVGSKRPQAPSNVARVVWSVHTVCMSSSQVVWPAIPSKRRRDGDAKMRITERKKEAGWKKSLL